MQKNFFIFVAFILCFILTSLTTAQEFPIDVGTDNTFGGGGAFDGTNFLFGIVGDASNQYSITAQLLSTNGTLVGPRISLGKIGSGLMTAFDGTNYLMVWTDPFPMFASGDTNGIGNLYGQFISTAGTLVGASFTIATDINIKFGKGRGTIVYNDTTYLVTYLKGADAHSDYLYGQRIGRSGILVGNPVQISSQYARECGIAFDGTNYLVAWCKVDQPLTDKYIYGQFISPAGTLVGQNFLIDGSENASDNPVTLSFNGSRCLVAFHDQSLVDSNTTWNLFGRFVTPAGVPEEKFMICDSSKNPSYASAAFDGKNYLITWMEMTWPIQVVGRFFTDTGIPIDSSFIVFDTLFGKFPIGGVGGFVNGRYLLSATRIDSKNSDADIYGMFLSPLLTKIDEQPIEGMPHSFSLSQNYPNPFNPSTTITYSLPMNSFVTLNVYNVLGKHIATLVNELREKGTHTAIFEAGKLSSGIYFITLRAGNVVMTKKIVLLQ